MEIETIKYGMIHNSAQCQECNWSDCLLTEKNGSQRLRARIKKHIKETHHTVNYETGTTTVYKPKL